MADNKNKMILGRYHESPNSFSFLQSNNKITPRSLNNSLAKNPQSAHDMMKLPSLTMRRSAISFTTERNTKNQLQRISEKLQQMQSQIHNVRMDANETLNHIRFVRQELVDNQLAKDHEDLKAQVAGLKRLVHFTKETHENRSNELREDYIRLWNQTEDMRQKVFQLKMKMDKIEDVMGSKNQ